MYGGVKETRCTNCEHRKVCSFKEQFLNAQKAVDAVSVSIGDKSVKYLRDFDWIKRVDLECVHFVPTKSMLHET
ncbi:hypothetical protein D1159_05855 [Pseudoflavonifractor sp. 524-17]|uniref:hypothetical protein n=1 Tax=Pseudoflavonifractor sp. 524-17 TaxID=2304577 RepID=UPI0013795A0F|nr:hypothetical protein [Pseudoflavonifractor sp. 524-17]NCE64122.1 hypothetical protein [Pseudoflavonifractor sp. 524-17]